MTVAYSPTEAAPQTCTFCQTHLAPDTTHMGQPFISASQLISTIVTTALRTPALLNDLLMKEMDQVPYCATCREQLAEKRQAEQLKLLVSMLVVLAVVIGVPLYLLYFA